MSSQIKSEGSSSRAPELLVIPGMLLWFVGASPEGATIYRTWDAREDPSVKKAGFFPAALPPSKEDPGQVLLGTAAAPG